LADRIELETHDMQDTINADPISTNCSKHPG